MPVVQTKSGHSVIVAWVDGSNLLKCFNVCPNFSCNFLLFGSYIILAFSVILVLFLTLSVIQILLLSPDDKTRRWQEKNWRLKPVFCPSSQPLQLCFGMFYTSIVLFQTKWSFVSRICKQKHVPRDLLSQMEITDANPLKAVLYKQIQAGWVISGVHSERYPSAGMTPLVSVSRSRQNWCQGPR